MMYRIFPSILLILQLLKFGKCKSCSRRLRILKNVQLQSKEYFLNNGVRMQLSGWKTMLPLPQ